MYQDIGIRVTVLGAAQFKRDIASINNSVNTLTNEFTRAVGIGPGLSSMLNSLGTSLVSIGNTLTRSVTLPLLAATSALTAYGISFEQAFTGVTKTVDGLSDEFGNLTAEGQTMRTMIRQLALDMPIAQNEIAKVTQVAGQLGVTGVDNLIAFTEEALKLGVATDFSAEEAATSFARLANILGVKSEDMGKFITQAGSAVVELGNNFAATEPEIIAVALRLSGAAKAVGILTPQILGISTALAALGVPAELGGTAVSRIFLNMQTMANSFTGDAKDATDQMKAFADVTGLTVNAFIDMIKTDPDQAFLRIIEGLGKMNDEGTLTLDVLKALDLDTIRTIDVLNRLGPNVSLVKDAIGAANKQWSEQTALQQEYNKFASTTLSKIKIMRNAFYDLGITLFDILKPGLETAIELVTKFATTISTKLQTNTKFQKELLALVAGLIALGPALIGVGNALRLIAPLFATFSFLFANPILLVALGAVAAAAIAIKENWFGLGDIFGAVGTAVAALIDSFANYELTLNALKLALDAFMRGDYAEAFRALKVAWEFFTIWFEKDGLPLLKEAWLKIRPMIEASVKAVASAFWTWITDTVIPNVLEQLGNLVDAVGTFIDSNLPLLGAKLAGWTRAFWSWVEDSFPTWLDKAEALITDIVGWIGENTPTLIEKLYEWAKAFVNWALDLWNGDAQNEGIKWKLGRLALQIVSWIFEKATVFTINFFTQWIPAFVNWAKDLWNGTSTNEGLKAKLVRWLGNILQWIVFDAPAAIWNGTVALGKAIVDGITNGIASNSYKILDAVRKLAKDLGIPDEILNAIGIPTSLGPPNLGPIGPTAPGMGNPAEPAVNSIISSLNSVLGDAVLGTALGTNNVSTNSSINSTNTSNNNFNPTINGVPLQDLSNVAQNVYDSWVAAQAVG